MSKIICYCGRCVAYEAPLFTDFHTERVPCTPQCRRLPPQDAHFPKPQAFTPRQPVDFFSALEGTHLTLAR